MSYIMMKSDGFPNDCSSSNLLYMVTKIQMFAIFFARNLTHWGLYKIAAILQRPFSVAFLQM